MAEPDPLITQIGPLVLFDGVCNLCNASVRFLGPRDRQGSLRFASVQSATGKSVLRAHGLAEDYLDSFVFLECGRARLKSDAFFRLLPYMGLPWTLLLAFRAVPRPAADWVYDRIARNRYRLFGKRESCMIPNPALAARFVE